MSTTKQFLEQIQLRPVGKNKFADLTCDECAECCGVIIQDEWAMIWPSFYTNDLAPTNMRLICPELIKVIHEYNNRIICPKCKNGCLTITEGSKFDAKTLLVTIDKKVVCCHKCKKTNKEAGGLIKTSDPKRDTFVCVDCMVTYE